MKSLKVIIVSVIALTLYFAVSDCYAGCCEPCIEVSACNPPCQGCPAIQIWTWDPVTLFPQNPTLQVINPLQINRPYLFKTWVKNLSNVEVRGVQVVFYWHSFGLFDYAAGTPIGSAAANLAPNESRLVSSPSVSIPYPIHVCICVRIFHPCDTKLDNNYCQMNLDFYRRKYPFKDLFVPFIMDFTEIKGKLNFKIDAPKGIAARIITREVKEEETARLKNEKGIMDLEVIPGFVRKCTLVITNAGADYKPGSSFDVTASAYQDDKLISSFTVRVEITK